MAKTALLNNIYIAAGALNLSGNTNQLSINIPIETVDVTNFASTGWKECLGGLKDADWDFSGFFEAAEPDSTLFTTDTSYPVSAVFANPPTENTVGWLMNCFRTRYAPDFNSGQAAAFSVNFKGAAPTIRSRVIDYATRTATANSTGFVLGAVSATQKLYAALHVTAASGTTPNLVVKLQSDDASGFLSPTDRVTFTAATAVTSQYATPVAGAITDTYYRASATITGTSPSFTYLLMAGIF